jgi:hypothetical protein
VTKRFRLLIASFYVRLSSNLTVPSLCEVTNNGYAGAGVCLSKN